MPTRGRPSLYTQDIADAICERLADGESLRSVCLDDDMPNKATVIRWLGLHQEFRDQYARARELQADALFDEVLHIANNTELGEKRTIKPDGGVEVVQADMIEHRRIKIDARKWMAGKIAPKKYGDKLLHTGGDGEGPVMIVTGVARAGD